MEKKEHIDFTAYLQSKNNWTTTIERYITQLEKFEAWLQNTKSKTLEKTQKKDILDYLHHLNERLNYSTRTSQQVLGILNHYFTFLIQNEQLVTNPITSIKLRGTNKRILQKLLSFEELTELLDTFYHLKVQAAAATETTNSGRFQSKKHIQQRNYLILSLSIYQGLNRSEWDKITLEDIDLQQARVCIRATRKSSARSLPLHATQIGILYDYLDTARAHFEAENNLLINSKPELQKLIKSIKEIYPKFTDFKQLRASIITYWIKNEGLRKAQYKAGHRYISSTEIYLWGELESLKNDINSFHPL